MQVTTKQLPNGTFLMPDPSAARLFGYVQVSPESNADEQRKALQRAGVPDNHIYLDEMLAAGQPQTGYDHLTHKLMPGDVLVLCSLDALGKAYADIIAQWQALTKGKQVDIAVLDIPLLDTRKQGHESKDDFLSDLAVQFLAYASMRERESSRRRQHEGILAAKARGVRFGRPPKPIPQQFDAVLQQWRNREISSRKAAQKLGVAQETFLRWSKKAPH